MTRILNLFFDLDGTIIEPQEGIIKSILYAADKMRLNETCNEELKQFIGPPLIESFMKRYNLNQKEGTKAVTLYREYYSEKGMYENNLYEGIDILLKDLYENGYKIFLTTSKPTVYAKQILEYHKLDQFFIDVFGSNLDNTGTDKTEIIERALRIHNLSHEETIMIGDRRYDIEGAKNNLVLSIWAKYGHGNSEEFNITTPDFIANNCEDIRSIINGI